MGEERDEDIVFCSVCILNEKSELLAMHVVAAEMNEAPLLIQNNK